MNDNHNQPEAPEKPCPLWHKPCSEVPDCGWLVAVMGRHRTLGTPVPANMCKLDAILAFVQQIAPVIQAMAGQPGRNPTYPTGG